MLLKEPQGRVAEVQSAPINESDQVTPLVLGAPFTNAVAVKGWDAPPGWNDSVGGETETETTIGVIVAVAEALSGGLALSMALTVKVIVGGAGPAVGAT